MAAVLAWNPVSMCADTGSAIWSVCVCTARVLCQALAVCFAGLVVAVDQVKAGPAACRVFGTSWMCVLLFMFCSDSLNPDTPCECGCCFSLWCICDAHCSDMQYKSRGGPGQILLGWWEGLDRRVGRGAGGRAIKGGWQGGNKGQAGRDGGAGGIAVWLAFENTAAGWSLAGC